jgi:hypothetical protein
VWPHGSRSERVVSPPPLPTDTLLSCWQVGSALAELNSALTPRSAGWCVRKSYRQVDPLGFRPGRAHVLQAQVKPQHLGSENHKSGDTLRSAPRPRSQIGCFELTPPKYPKRLLLPILFHSRQEPLFPSQHMHREAQRIHMLINIYSSRTIKGRIFKVGCARFINMHLK